MYKFSITDQHLHPINRGLRNNVSLGLPALPLRCDQPVSLSQAAENTGAREHGYGLALVDSKE